jgi:large subunit ribosomal protein L3
MKNLDKELKRRLLLPKSSPKENDGEIIGQEIRAICYTQPIKITGVPKKAPDIFEIRIGGGSVDERIKYAKNMLGKEIKVGQVFKEGEMIDVAAVTKGKGFQGHVKRWGVKLLTHKNSKHRRMIGTLGPWHPSWIRSTVPQAGQMGYYHRTEYNKRILKIGEGEEITPDGGFPHYGIVRENYLLIHGSIPGPPKRLIRMRKAIRYTKGVKVEKPEITYISLSSKQGV